MNSAHVEKIAEAAYKRYANKVIAELQSMGREAMQSGDDSPYNNVWEEYAAQVQGEESVFWEMYEEMVEQWCGAIVQAFSQTEREFLWLFSEAGQNWTRDIDYDKEHGIPHEPEEADFWGEDIIKELYSRIYTIANNMQLPENEYGELDL